MRSFTLLTLAVAAVPALADTHYFYSGFFSGSTIVGVEFDDETSSLTLVNNITTDASSGSKWIHLDVSWCSICWCSGTANDLSSPA